VGIGGTNLVTNPPPEREGGGVVAVDVRGVERPARGELAVEAVGTIDRPAVAERGRIPRGVLVTADGDDV